MKSVKIVVIGGSFGGKSFIHSLLDSIKANPIDTKFEVTLVDYRKGFINILAIPRAVVNYEFAKSTYATDLELPFDEPTEHFQLNFVHGKVVDLTNKAVQILKIKNDDISDEKLEIKFDYCVVSPGKSRSWPFDPKGFTKESYLEEMKESVDEVVKALKIAVIGGGAVGIETAAELKVEYHDKQVLLLHPYKHLPPDHLDLEYKEKIMARLVDIGVELKMEKRLLHKTLDGFVTNDGELIKCDLILNCAGYQNNTQFLESFFSECLDSRKEVCINAKCQIIENYPEDQSPFKGVEHEVKYDNVFAIGDCSKFPVIKAAGGAFRQAIVVATNLFNKMADKKIDEVVVETWSDGLLMLVGPGYLIGNRDGEITLNDEIGEKVYKDFANGFVSTYYHVKFDGVSKWDL